MKREGSHYLLTPIFNTIPMNYDDYRILMVYVESGLVYTTFSRSVKEPRYVNCHRVNYRTLEGVPVKTLPDEVVRRLAVLAVKNSTYQKLFDMNNIRGEIAQGNLVNQPYERWRSHVANCMLYSAICEKEDIFEDPKYAQYWDTFVPGIGFRTSAHWYGVVIPDYLYDRMSDDLLFYEINREEAVNP